MPATATDVRRDCVVAATGPSLTAEVAKKCRDRDVFAVNDAWKRIPWAKVLYGSDAAWWDVSGPGPDEFHGERLTTFVPDKRGRVPFKVAATAWNRGVHFVRGRKAPGFSTEPDLIHFGNSSGFAAVNLAILRGYTQIYLAGFDMRAVAGQRHFFGDHPEPLCNNTFYPELIEPFVIAAKQMPDGVQIINCTPGSALTCFRFGEL